MNAQKAKGILGMALRARQAAMGTDACMIMIRSGKCGVLLMDAETGINTSKKIREICERYRTPVRIVPEGMIEQASGKSNMILGLPAGSFADGILQCIQDDI